MLILLIEPGWFRSPCWGPEFTQCHGCLDAVVLESRVNILQEGGSEHPGAV